MHAAAQASSLATVPEILAGIDTLFRRALSFTRAQVNKAADANQALCCSRNRRPMKRRLNSVSLAAGY